MGKNKDKSVEEHILDSLSTGDLLHMVQEELEDSGYCLGDKVQLITDSKGDKVYTIYSYTTYADGRINYTLWNGADYEMYEPWQVKHYIPPVSIGLNNL